VRDKEYFFRELVKEVWTNDCYGFVNQWKPIRTPRFIVDAGANMGVFTILAASLYPECKIFSFEPLGDIFEVLKENVIDDDVDILCYNKALIGNSEPIGIAFSRNPGGNTCIYDNNKSYRGKDRFGQEWTPRQIDSLSLNELFEEQQIDFIDFLKMDVEGSEYEILFHAEKMGLFPRIHTLSMEIHGKPSKSRIAPEYDRLISMLKSNYKNFVQKDNMVFCSSPLEAKTTQGEKMSLKEQQEKIISQLTSRDHQQIIELRIRISDISDEISTLKADLKFFKEVVARDIKRALGKYN